MRNFVSFVSHFAARLLLVVLFCLPVWGGNVMAQESEPYVVFDSSTGVLVFKYDTNKPKGAYRLNEEGTIPEWTSENHNLDIKEVVFDDSFAQARPTNCFGWFYHCDSLKVIYGIRNLITSDVTDMSAMFMGCSSLTTLDVSGFDTHNVTKMVSMFCGCSSLTTLDVSGFDTHKVTDMSYMFWECSNLTTLDVSGFDTYNVTDIVSMFGRCHSLTTLDVSGFDTHNVTDINGMFSGCSGLKTLDVSGFDTHNVTDIDGMFSGCSGLKTLDVSGFDTYNVLNMAGMFGGCSGLTSLDLSGFDTHNVMGMTYMFYGCSSLATLDISSFDTHNVMFMDSLFSFCSRLITIYVSDKFVMSDDIDGHAMFNGCFSLKGATAYDDYKVGKDMANYNTGYFTTYYKIADELYPLCGESLNVENLTLVDGKNFVARAPFEAATVSYSRKMNADITWETLCLPFDFSLENQNFRAFKLLSVNGDMVELQEVKSCVAAGTPIIIKMNPGAIDINIKECESMIVREAQTSEIVDNCQLVGLYMQKKLSSVEEDNCCFIVKDGKLMNAAMIKTNTTAKDVELDGFRAYMRDRGFWSSQAKVYTLVFDDDTNGVKNLEITTEGKEEYYDLQGHQLDDLQKGVNIVKRGDKTIKVIVK